MTIVPDPDVFGAPGSGSVPKCHESGTLIPTKRKGKKDRLPILIKILKITVLQIRDVYPGSNFYPSRIPDPNYLHLILDPHWKIMAPSVADPGSSALLTPGSGIQNRFFPDPGSQTHIFESILKIFWVKTSTILWKLAQIFFLSILKIKYSILWNLWQQKSMITKYFSSLIFVTVKKFVRIVPKQRKWPCWKRFKNTIQE